MSTTSELRTKRSPEILAAEVPLYQTSISPSGFAFPLVTELSWRNFMASLSLHERLPSVRGTSRASPARRTLAWTCVPTFSSPR